MNKIQLIKILIVGLCLTIIFPKRIDAQGVKGTETEKEYSKFTIILGPSLFDKAIMNPVIKGEYSPKNRLTPSVIFGFEYKLIEQNNLSLITGLNFDFGPTVNFELEIGRGDIDFYNESLLLEARSYSIVTFSSPLLLNYSKKIKNTKLFITTGLKIMYLPNGKVISRFSYRPTNTFDEVKLGGLEMFSPKNIYQGSFVFGLGFKRKVRNSEVGVKVIRVVNFQNTFEGTYWFGSFINTDSFSGEYKVSGNYTGILLSYTLPKFKLNFYK